MNAIAQLTLECLQDHLHLVAPAGLHADYSVNPVEHELEDGHDEVRDNEDRQVRLAVALFVDTCQACAYIESENNTQVDHPQDAFAERHVLCDGFVLFPLLVRAKIFLIVFDHALATLLIN